MIKWIQSSRLSIKESFSAARGQAARGAEAPAALHVQRAHWSNSRGHTGQPRCIQGRLACTASEREGTRGVRAATAGERWMLQSRGWSRGWSRGQSRGAFYQTEHPEPSRRCRANSAHMRFGVPNLMWFGKTFVTSSRTSCAKCACSPPSGVGRTFRLPVAPVERRWYI